MMRCEYVRIKYSGTNQRNPASTMYSLIRFQQGQKWASLFNSSLLKIPGIHVQSLSTFQHTRIRFVAIDTYNPMRGWSLKMTDDRFRIGSGSWSENGNVFHKEESPDKINLFIDLLSFNFYPNSFYQIELRKYRHYLITTIFFDPCAHDHQVLSDSTLHRSNQRCKYWKISYG